MICPRCQSTVREGALFCLNCGLRVEGSAGSSPEPRADGASVKRADAEPVKPAPPPSFSAPSEASSSSTQKRAKLVIQSGSKAGREFELDKPECTLGRVPGSDIFVEDVRVSRNHARIVNRLGEFFVEDLGSANGTFVNGSQIIDSVRLKHGDVVIVGGSSLLFQEATASVSAEEPPRQPEDLSERVRAPAAAGPSKPAPEWKTSPLPSMAAMPASSTEKPAAQPDRPLPEPPAAMKDGRGRGAAKQVRSAISHARTVTSEIRDLLEADRHSVQELTDRAVALRSELEASGKRALQLESELASALDLLARLEEEWVRQMGKVQEAASKLRGIVAEDTALMKQVNYEELLSTIENVSANPRDIECVSALAKRAEPISRLVRAQRAAMSALEQVANSLGSMTETH